MSALTDLDSQVTLAEKAVADLKMRAQQLMDTPVVVDTSSSGSNLGLGSGGPAPREGGGLREVNSVNTELGISTSNGGVDTRLPQDPSDIKVGPPVDPLADVGPTTSNGTTLTDDAKDVPKATIMVEAPNNKMRNLLVLFVLAFGAYMVFRKK
jgi:hypothetical protein